MDQLRAVNYVPREALFRTLGGPWFHLVPFAVAVGSNEGDRPHNVLFKTLTDSAGEDGDQGVYLVEEPVQETASPVETNITEIAPELAYHVSGAHQQISPSPVTYQQTVKHMTEGAQINERHTEHCGSQREQVPSGQEPFLVEEPVSVYPASKTNITEKIPEEADNISPRQQVSTPAISTQAVGSQQEQVPQRQEPPRQSILELRQETSHRDQKPTENDTTHTIGDGVYREMCSKRLRNFLLDDATDLRSPTESSHAVVVEETNTEFRPELHSHQTEMPQGTHPVMEDEPQEVRHSQEINIDEAPTTEEISAVTNDASIAHILESPLAVEGELPITEEAPTHESLSVQSEVDEWETIVVEEVDAATQTSQEWLPISEEPIALRNDASSPLTVEGELPVREEAPTIDTHESVGLHSEVDEWETMVVEEVDVATQTSQDWLPIPQELNGVMKGASLAHIRERPHAVEGELHVIEAPTTDNYESVSVHSEVGNWKTVVVEEVDTATQTPQEWLPIPQQPNAVIKDAPATDNYQSISVHSEVGDWKTVVVKEVDTATQTPHEWSRIPKELNAVMKGAPLAHIQESPRAVEGELNVVEVPATDSHESVSVHSEVDEEEIEVVEEGDAVTQISQELLPIPQELKTVTKDASLAHIRESTHGMEEELHEGSLSDRLEQVATTGDIARKDSQPVIEDEPLDDSHPQVISGLEAHKTKEHESPVQGSHPEIEELQTTDHRESLSIHAQDADERESALVEPEAATQPSQEILPKSEDPSAMTNDASLDHIRKSPLAVEKTQVVETASTEKLIEEMKVQQEAVQSVASVFPPRASSTKKGIKPRRLISDLEQLSSSTEIPERLRDEDSHYTLYSKTGSASEQDDADGRTPGRESIVLGYQQETEESPNIDHRESLSVQPEDTDDKESELVELYAATQTSQKWLFSTEELIATTNEEPLTSIRQSPLAMMEEPSKGGYIEGAKSQEDQMSARVKTPLKGIYKATEETEHDEHETAKLVVGREPSPVKDIHVVKEVTTPGERHHERLRDQQEQTSDTPEEHVHDIHQSAEEILRGDTHPGKPSSQLQEEQMSNRAETPLKGIQKAREEIEHDENYSPKLVVGLEPSITKTPVKDIHVAKEVTTQGEHDHEGLSDEQEQTLKTAEEPIHDVRQSAEKRYVQPATDEELHKDRLHKEITTKQKPIEPESTTSKQVGPSLIQERMRQLQQLEKPSGRLQPVSAISDKSKQVVQPATDEELRKDRLPKKIIKQKPISPVSTTPKKIGHSFVQERLRGFQQRGKPSGQVQLVSATSGKLKQFVQPTKDEELHKDRVAKEIIKQKPISPVSTTSKQSGHSFTQERMRGFQQHGQPSAQLQPVSTTSSGSKQEVQPEKDDELHKGRFPKEMIKPKPLAPWLTTSKQIGPPVMPRGFQQQGKPSGQVQPVLGTSGESKQDIKPETDQKLHKDSFSKETIKPKPSAPRSTTSRQIGSSLMLRGFQQRGKPSGQIQPVSATSGESKQDGHPGTKGTLQMGRGIAQEPISSRSTAYKPGVHLVTEQTLHGGVQSKIPFARQERYPIKLQIPTSGTHSAKEEASQARTSPGVFPVRQESVSQKPAGQSTIHAGQAPAQPRVRPAVKSPVQAEPKRVVPRRGIQSKLQFWQEKTAPTSKPSPKGIHRTNQDRERQPKKSSVEKEQISSKPGTLEGKSSEDD